MKPTNLNNKRLLICLDMTYMDDLLMRYVVFLCKQYPELEEVVYYHNIYFDGPQVAEKITSGLNKPLKDILKERIATKLKKTTVPCKTTIHVQQGEDTAKEIVRTLLNEQFDLVVMGKKVTYDGSGYLIERLLHLKPEADLLVLPENAPYSHSHWLVPIEFNMRSKALIDRLRQRVVPQEKALRLIHVYEIPKVYFPYIPMKGMQQKMEDEARRNWKRFKDIKLKDFSTYTFVLRFHEDRTIAETIYDYALSEQIDAIFLPMEMSVIRSKVIQLLRLNMHIPLFILR